MGRYASYTAGFKLKVVEHALEHGNRAAGRHFSVDPVRVRYWRNQQDELRATKKDRRAFRGPKQGKFPRVEEEVLSYVKRLRNEGCAVSHELMQNHARATARSHGIAASEFKASSGWTTRFMRRNGLCLRRRTTLCQRLPADCEDKVRDFHRFIIRIREDKKFLLSQIGNADQTPINFDMPRNSTVDIKGAKSVQVKTTGAEKQWCTVMLSITVDGRQLPPFVVFKRKTLPKGTLPAGIHVRAQEKGWMSAELVSDWLKTVWGRRPGALLLPSLLVMDSFRGHLEKNVRCRMSELRTDLAVIPGGLTSVLQPLDVSINKPFKDNVRRLYTEWMAAGNHDLTPAGKIRRPTIDMLCRWIIEAWSVIPREMVVRSFKKTGISNSLDGTEDDALWEDADADEVASDMSGSVDSDSEPE
uniref:Putative pogo transposable element n=1 Tax=Amblyomma aureolatum TaxID=187763 RepID=A0A1E1X208_9ACAR